MSDAVANPTDTASSHDDGHHALKLWPFFLALLALTAAEVGLYETWRGSAETLADGSKSYFIPKFALVWAILIFTLPKAYIVLVYFMHLRFEKALIVGLAIIPLFMVFICILPTLTDITTLKERQINPVKEMNQQKMTREGNAHGADHKHDPDH